jgi:plasmid stabilization system protein ParE
MRFSYKLARSARRNLQAIADYWMARAGEGVALRIVSGILETIITLIAAEGRHTGRAIR